MQYPLELDFDYGTAPDRLGDGAKPSFLRWQALLPPLSRQACLGAGDTPLIEIGAAVQAPVRERGVFLKDESRNPTWSHKDRLNVCTVSAALQEGASTVIVASSGNHGVSAAAHAARAGLRCVVVTMPEVSPAFREMILAYGAHPVFLPAEARWPAMRAMMQLKSVYPVSNLTPVHTGHPWGPEGYKTIAYEIAADLGRAPAAVVVPTGYGEMLFGIFKGFRELRDLGLVAHLPQIVSVEPAARGPLHRALATGVPAVSVEPRPTLQSGTACTVNSYRAVVAVRERGGLSLLVDDEEAGQAQRALARQGLWQELSPSAAVAALGKIDRLEHDGPVVVIGCSTGLKEPAAHREVRVAEPDLTSIRAYLKSEYGFDL
ncbi:pyridoxal-phosphate dependent enzyme [Inquilinus limosus]|uniref:threonine synthase n=1 Tax=Inquilinus limosus TaxID=171674 RepID=UPI003F140186